MAREAQVAVAEVVDNCARAGTVVRLGGREDQSRPELKRNEHAHNITMLGFSVGARAGAALARPTKSAELSSVRRAIVCNTAAADAAADDARTTMDDGLSMTRNS